MEGLIIKKILISLYIIFPLFFSGLTIAANNFDTNNSNESTNMVQEIIDLDGFIDSIKKYSNEYFPELANENFINQLINGNESDKDNNLMEKIINAMIGEFKANISLILKIIGIAILCSILKNIQNNFLDSNISEIAFYVCYLMVVIVIITSFTNVITLCVDTVDKLSDFMNMVIPLIFALIAVTGNLTTISFLQPLIIGIIALITYVLNNFIIPIIYISTVINIVTNISSHIKLDKLSEMLKKSSLWVMEFSLLIFTGILSLEGTLAASVDGMTSKIAKNIVSSTIPVVGKVLGDTVDSVIGGISITKNAIGFIGIISILAITISPLIKSLITMIVFNLSAALIEPIADSRISKCMSGVASSLKIIVGILAVVIFIFIIAITMMLKISNNAIMYK